MNALKSVLAQTYRPIEVMIVDNVSTDNTPEVVKGFSREHVDKNFEVVYIRRDKNDRNAARNQAIQRSTGKFICFLDDDDEYAAEKIAKQVEHFRDNPRMDVSFTNSLLDADGRTVVFIDFKKEGLTKHDNETIKARLCLGNFIPITNVMIKADLMKSFPFDPALHTLEDFELWLRLIKDHTFDWIDEPLAVVHSHDHEIRYDQIQVRMDQINVLLRHINSFPEYFFGMMDKLARLKSLVLNEYSTRNDQEGAKKFSAWFNEQCSKALGMYVQARPSNKNIIKELITVYNIRRLKRRLGDK